MDHVATDQQRNAETTFLDSDALQLVDSCYVDLIDYRTDTAGTYRVTESVNRIGFAGVQLAHLADFLGERHALQQVRYTLCSAFRVI